MGFADGLPRDRGSESSGFVYHSKTGVPLQIKGNPCMDSTLLGVPNDLDIQVGDEITVTNDRFPVEGLAKWAKTNSTEIICGIGNCSRNSRYYKGKSALSVYTGEIDTLSSRTLRAIYNWFKG
jgi:alanine racemase